MFEHKRQPLLSPKLFFRRIAIYFFISTGILAFSLLLGMSGYHFIGGLSWIDSLLNASMILTGMGPVAEMKTDAAKLFASFYALYSGVAFLTTFAVLLAPALHRFMHILHLESGN
ncbi:MAG TPA: hypothetical protein VNJ07_03305 [Chitinophagales bacterium]|nr:hypothetical protein [Chitinophagales bacterium]